MRKTVIAAMTIKTDLGEKLCLFDRYEIMPTIQIHIRRYYETEGNS